LKKQEIALQFSKKKIRVDEPTQKEGKRVPADPDSSAGIDAAAYEGLIPLLLFFSLRPSRRPRCPRPPGRTKGYFGKHSGGEEPPRRIG